MKVPCRADFHLQKPGIAKTANCLFGGAINDFQPHILRCGWTPIREKLLIDRLQSFAPRDCVALNHDDKNGVALAVRKAFFASNQLLTEQLRRVSRKSLSRIGWRSRCRRS